jgi:hypothetical protein
MLVTSLPPFSSKEIVYCCGAVVVGAVVVGAVVVGTTVVVGATVVGATVVGAIVVDPSDVGSSVVGASVVTGSSVIVTELKKSQPTRKKVDKIKSVKIQIFFILPSELFFINVFIGKIY